MRPKSLKSKKKIRQIKTRKARNIFLEGLVVLMPLSLSIYVIYLLISWTRARLAFTLHMLPPQFQDVFWVKILLEIAVIILIVLFIYFMGWLTSTFIGKAFGRFIESIINRLPIINSLYRALKQLFKTFVSYQDNQYSKAVLIQYPHPNIWAIAFLTSEAPLKLSPEKKNDYYTVFMPSTPNPTTGFFMIVAKKDVIVLDISIEEAIKVIMSGGLLNK